MFTPQLHIPPVLACLWRFAYDERFDISKQKQSGLLNSNFPLIGTNFFSLFCCMSHGKMWIHFLFFFLLFLKIFLLPLLPNSFSSTCTATRMFGFQLPYILFSFFPTTPDKVSFLSHLVSWRLQMKGQGWILTILDKISKYFYSCKRSWFETKMVAENAIQSLLIKLFLFRVGTTMANIRIVLLIGSCKALKLSISTTALI